MIAAQITKDLKYNSCTYTEISKLIGSIFEKYIFFAYTNFHIVKFTASNTSSTRKAFRTNCRNTP